MLFNLTHTRLQLGGEKQYPLTLFNSSFFFLNNHLTHTLFSFRHQHQRLGRDFFSSNTQKTKIDFSSEKKNCSFNFRI